MNFLKLVIILILLRKKDVLCFNIQTKVQTMLRPLTDQVDLEHPINFGVSLATINRQNHTILLAGAPAADLGDFNEKPGQVFNCDLDGQLDRSKTNSDQLSTKQFDVDCKPIKLFNQIKGHNKAIILNDYMQLSSSISSSDNGKFTICAAGTLNQYFSDHYPNGQCWIGNYNNSSNESLDSENQIHLNNLYNINPLNDTKRQTVDSNRHSTYFFSHGMFGFSSKISKDDSQIIYYGAVGYHEWRGCVIQVKLAKNGQKMINLYKHDLGPYIYFGFSIALAHLFSERKLFCVVSAPKSKSTGAVIIFEPSPMNRLDIIKEVKINKLKTFYGSVNGEYFGCSVEAIDLNNDGLDDIIIGAPYYSVSNKELIDNGAVYIYMSNENDFEDPLMLFGSGESNAMFGYSIASAGDLDQDGYQDFVVGAPYEDDSGCVYIYNGRLGSPSVHYSQKICATQFNQIYRGFGIKVHGSFDVDSNNYPDLAIGAYLSKNVLLLKSRPVARITAQFNLNVTSINLNDKSKFCLNERYKQSTFCFELTFCQMLAIKHAEHLNEDQILNTTLQLDVFKLANQINSSQSIFASSTTSRAYFELNSIYQPKYKKFFSNNLTTTNSITFQSKLTPNVLICFAPFLVMLRTDIEDKLKPILITSTHKLSKKANCVQNCPVLLNENQQFTESINFHTGCAHTKCLSNLNFEMNLQTQQNYINDLQNSDELIELKELVIGFHRYCILNVRLKNQGEQAYSTYLELNLMPSLQIKKIESRCKSRYQQFNDLSRVTRNKREQKNNYLEIFCNLGNPFEKGTIDLQFIFDLFNTELDSKLFTVNGSVHTSSALTNNSQVHRNLVIPLRRQISILLKDTQQTTNTILFDFKSKNSSNDQITFSNHFQMLKNGNSNIPVLELIIFVPTNYTNLTLINGVNIESLDGSSFSCDQINFDTLDLMSESELMYKSKISNVFNDIETKILNENETEDSPDFVQFNVENELYTNGQLNLNCQTMNCTKFRCLVQSVGFSKQIRLFKLTGNIDLNKLDQVFDGLSATNFSQIKLRNDLKLMVLDSLIDLYQDFDNNLDDPSILTAIHSTYITIKQIPGREQIAFWIILTSVSFGLFILSLLIISLIKLGFFKREKRDQVRRLKQKQRETLLLNSLPQVIN